MSFPSVLVNETGLLPNSPSNEAYPRASIETSRYVPVVRGAKRNAPPDGPVGGCPGTALGPVTSTRAVLDRCIGPGHVGGACYGRGMDGHVGPGSVGGGCYAPAMLEASADSVTAERPSNGGRGCHRLDTGEPIQVTTAAAVLVAEVAGARPAGAAPPSYSHRTSEAWLELERRLELVTKAA